MMAEAWMFWCTLALACVTQSRAYFDPVRFPGEYCERRAPAPRCCLARNDDCSFPIYKNQTRCYCDMFCNQRASKYKIDCCPDFYKYTSECLQPSSKPLPGCTLGETRMEDCNKCTCVVSYTLPYNYNNRQWRCTQSACINDKTLIDSINSNSRYFGWTASAYNKFAGITVNDGMSYFMGTLEPKSLVHQQTPISKPYQIRYRRSFDARVHWPQLIQPAMDQGRCSASWAFSSASVTADRWAIQTGGDYKNQLSPQQMISCGTFSMSREACAGRRVEDGWWWLKKDGAINEACYPYTSGNDRLKGACINPRVLRCTENGPRIQQRTTPAYRIGSNEDDIMAEIHAHGPVQALIKVRPDFFLYRRGVYSHTGLQMLKRQGYHSVKIIGWGVENNIKYWLAINSWGLTWANGGTFKIKRGVNESGIEEFVLAAWARTPHSKYKLRSILYPATFVHFLGK